MPITSKTSSRIVPVDESGSRALYNASKFTLGAPPSRKRPAQPNPNLINEPSCSGSPNNRRRASVTQGVSPLSPFSSLFALLEPSVTRTVRRASAYGIDLGAPAAHLSPVSTFVPGKSHRRSLSNPSPCTALAFETPLAPSPVSPGHILFQRACALATLKGDFSAPSSTAPDTSKPKSKTRPRPIMTTGKNGHINVLLLPKSRDKEGGASSIRSGTSASTSASKSKSRKTPEPSSSSTKTGKSPNPTLRAQRSLTPARGIANDTFRPLPYATHAALDEFFGDPRKMNALHAHQSSSKQLGARPEEVGYGNTIGHRGADGWIWFDAIEEQEYAWLMSEAASPGVPDTARPKEKKTKRRGLFGRRGSVASVSSGGRSDWESFDPLRRGSESGTSDSGIVDPATYDLDPTLPPRYRAPVTGMSATYRAATLDAGAWDAALHAHMRQSPGGVSAPKSRRGRSRRGSSSKENRNEERRRPPPLNLTAVTHALVSLGPSAIPVTQPTPPVARRPSLPANYLFPASLANAARADFVSSSYQPHPSKRDLNLDPETPWSANLPQETIYRSIGSDLHAPSPTPGSPFKAMFSRRASLTPLPLRHNPAPLPKSGRAHELKGAEYNGTLPKLPPMPTEHGTSAPGEGRRKASLADIFRRGFSVKGSRK
ncbi:hypothetical protein CTheo_2891 [Ceratobasidium theobromae]|uniref:Uncharacterized protein n=1 Tax=Ceratobasidium theobromae TaxID=1582974 RepID=A0A5N5QQ20_9AGAM|nr:hypothetical protein CTheo_2891 [Ceratobasidium theobromae]